MQGCVHGHGRSMGTAAISAVTMGASMKSGGGTEAVSAKQSIFINLYLLHGKKRENPIVSNKVICSYHPSIKGSRPVLKNTFCWQGHGERKT